MCENEIPKTKLSLFGLCSQIEPMTFRLTHKY